VNKTDLIRAISTAAGATKVDTANVVDAFIKVIEDTLASQDSIRIVGFGTFKTSKIQKKTVRNPQNGKEMILPEHFRPVFRPGKRLKEVVNKKIKK